MLSNKKRAAITHMAILITISDLFIMMKIFLPGDDKRCNMANQQTGVRNPATHAGEIKTDLALARVNDVIKVDLAEMKISTGTVVPANQSNKVNI